ncbi:hypothetical protein [Streptomyces sp. NPDC101178]|uniref:hypothetical protein n=1 Tax=Streptomyces sp. NPDC101178 TaxID=3366124 RepID=UPI00382CA9BD
MALRTGQHLDHQLGGERGVGLAGLGAVLARGGDIGQERAEPGGQGRIQRCGQAGPALCVRDEREAARAVDRATAT